MFVTIVATAIVMIGTFWLLSSALGEVTAARIGAAIAVIGGPVLASYLTGAGIAGVVRAIAIEVALGAFASVASAALNTSTEFLFLGLATAWVAGTATAIQGDGVAVIVGRLLVMLSVGPVLLVAAVWGFDFYIVGALPALVALASLTPLGDVLGRFVADAGALAEDGRVERP